MPKFCFLLLKRAPVKVALNCFMLLLSLKLLKRESREQLATLKNFMAVQQPARGFTSSLFHSTVNYFPFFKMFEEAFSFFFSFSFFFFDRKVYNLPPKLVELIRASSRWKKIQITYPDPKKYNIFPLLRSGYLVHFQIGIKF